MCSSFTRLFKWCFTICLVACSNHIGVTNIWR
jgi:hypothetical protein